MGISYYNYKRSSKLAQNTSLTSEQTKLILSLKKLRNKIVHNTDISVSEETALEYRKACFEVLQFLDNIDDNSNSQRNSID